MPIPVNTIDTNKEADSVVRYLQQIKREADAAASLTNETVLELYFRLIRATAKFDALSNAGYTIEVLGPVLGEKFGVSWTDHEADFVALKNNAGPAFVGFVLANQAEICRHELQGDRMIFTPLSSATKSAILPLINDIASLLG